MNMKYNDIYIYDVCEVTLKLCLIFPNIQNVRHCEAATFVLPAVVPEVEYASKIAISISDILSFWSML